ncbi:TlpA family protein disulfide reductase [Saccharospirillum impatiens]|uniref:TlpA family protein disulfide reductase n=1 Tax=Saccharospirillum impatiens TaxID=169438 RepID=UPI0003F7A6B6|nr:TlpA disulfide reductase family protein [Saccharospirillum impatiens]
MFQSLLTRIPAMAIIGTCVTLTSTAIAETFRPVTGLALPDVPALLTLKNEVSDSPEGPVFINIWASWCKPCIDELPALNALKARYPDAGVQWLALNYGDSLDQVKQFMNTHSIDMPVMLDATTQFTRQLPLTGLPATFLVDSHGQVRYQLDGYADWNDPALIRQWEALLPELTQ